MSSRKELKFEMVGDCKICVGHKVNDKGQIRYTVNGKTQYMHRYFWEQIHGEVAKGMFIQQTCGDTRCMNVDHMECITMVEKNTRMNVSKGEHRPTSKLKEHEVIRIVNNTIHSDKELAKMYGVSRQHINAIRNSNKYWQYLWNGVGQNEAISS
jgi:hypothetical protein